MVRPPAHFVTLLHEALLRSFNRKKALRRFLRSSGLSEKTLAQWHGDESKRDWLDKLIPTMLESERGCRILNEMGRQLAEQTAFPDLAGFEESVRMVADAKSAVAALAKYFKDHDRRIVDERERQALREQGARRRAEAQQARGDIQVLANAFTALSQAIGTQSAGYDFESWFYDLAAFFEIEHRRPYRGDGRQIDGSITIDGTTYLVETKFTTEPAEPKDVADFYRKVVRKADNTMGVFVSVCGFSEQAVREASGERSPLLLFRAEHLLHVLQGIMTMPEVVRRVRRHASQTGEPLLLPRDF